MLGNVHESVCDPHTKQGARDVHLKVTTHPPWLQLLVTPYLDMKFCGYAMDHMAQFTILRSTIYVVQVYTVTVPYNSIL